MVTSIYESPVCTSPCVKVQREVPGALSAMLEAKVQVRRSLMSMPGKVLGRQGGGTGKTSANTHSRSLWHMSSHTQQRQDDSDGDVMAGVHGEEGRTGDRERRHWRRQQRGWGLATRLQLSEKEGCTFTAALNLSAPMQGIVDEVRQAPVQVHGCQAALKAIPGGHQLGEVAVHALGQASHVEVPWKKSRR